ncbi:MAG: lysine-sensitive aspartokinase 3 [Candidatus Korobacteraceae bacterium]|jgi:aspartate kinase
MIVMKFGGTSVEDAKAITRVASIVAGRRAQQPVVVVSAMGGVTDVLVAMARGAAGTDLPASLKSLQGLRERHYAAGEELKVASQVNPQLQSLFDSLEVVLRGIAALGELSPRTMDNVMSYGEICSSTLVTAAFNALGIESELVDSRECLITDSAFTRAAPDFAATNERMQSKLLPLLARNRVVVMGGFIASNAGGITTTLGRGGSDYSASIVGAALSVDCIEIWTDVKGVMTTDPRLCPNARKIDEMSFAEASEMAYFGAKVLHPATVIPAVEKDIPVYVLDSRHPEGKGTCIRAQAPPCETVFRAIAAKKNVTIISMRTNRGPMAFTYLKGLFEVFERHGLSADLVSTSEASISIALDSAGVLSPLMRDLKQFGDVEVETGKAIVCLVSEEIKYKVGVAASVFTTLAAANVNIHMISQGASEINIGVVIEESDMPEAIRHLHARFFEQSQPLSAAATGGDLK